jgi:hypothetical protein
MGAGDVDAMDRELADVGSRCPKTSHSGVAEPYVSRRAYNLKAESTHGGLLMAVSNMSDLAQAR